MIPGGKEQTAIEKFMQGISDSTLGDRAKAVKTYREFVAAWHADLGEPVGVQHGAKCTKNIKELQIDKNLCVI